MLDKNLTKQIKGFTIVEMLVVVSIIIILAGLSSVHFTSIISNTNLDVSIQTVTGQLQRAQILSQAVKEDSTWGVRISSGQVVVFKGSDYINRDPNFDEISSVPEVIIFSGLSEVVFSKMYGFPDVTGDIDLLAPGTGETKTVNINSRGRLDY